MRALFAGAGCVVCVLAFACGSFFAPDVPEVPDATNPGIADVKHEPAAAESVPTGGMTAQRAKGGRSIATAADCIWDTYEKADALDPTIDDDDITALAWTRCNHLMPIAPPDTRPGECVRRVQREVFEGAETRYYIAPTFEEWERNFTPGTSQPSVWGGMIFFASCIPPYETK